MATGIAVASPTLVYAWAESKDEYDQILAQEVVGGWEINNAITKIKNDGNTWKSRFRSKSVSGPGQDGVTMTVVFQWFEERCK